MEKKLFIVNIIYQKSSPEISLMHNEEIVPDNESKNIWSVVSKTTSVILCFLLMAFSILKLGVSLSEEVVRGNLRLWLI